MSRYKNRIRLQTWIVASLLTSGCTLVPLMAQTKSLPAAVSACLASHPEVALNTNQRPPYLRVAFEDNAETDYVVAVLYKADQKSRAMVCRPGKPGLVLGVPGADPFSDMYADNYMSSEWRRCSRSEVRAMAKNYHGVPFPANDSVCLDWEDGESLIYWQGGHFRWKDLRP